MNSIDKNIKMANASCTLYVGGLVTGDRNAVRKAFESYGNIEKVDYLEAKACAFVKFEDADAARTAMEEMHGARVAGQNVRCGWAKERSVSQEERENTAEQGKNRSRTPASPPLKVQRMNTPDPKKSTSNRKNIPDLRRNTPDQWKGTFNQWRNGSDRWNGTPEHHRMYSVDQQMLTSDPKMNTPHREKRINVTDQKMNTPDGKKSFSVKRICTNDENLTSLVQRINTPDNKKSPLLDTMTTPITVEKAKTLVQKMNTPVQKICTSNEKVDLEDNGIKTPVSTKKLSTPIQKTYTPLRENLQQSYQTPIQNSPRNQYRQSPKFFSARKVKTNKENFANGSWLQVPDCKSLPLPPSRWLKPSPEISTSPTTVSTSTATIPSSNTTISPISSNQTNTTNSLTSSNKTS